MKALRILPLFLVFLFSGCATPPEVKQLSLKQMEYFDSAIDAVSSQSEALILATEEIVKNATIEIDKKVEENRKKMENLVVNKIPTYADEKKKATAIKLLKEVEETVRVTERSKRNLEKDLAIVKKKSNELSLYLKKMKEVHLSIDAYVQSEKAGEKVVSDMLGHPSVNDLITKVDSLIPKIKQESEDLLKIIGSLK